MDLILPSHFDVNFGSMQIELRGPRVVTVSTIVSDQAARILVAQANAYADIPPDDCRETFVRDLRTGPFPWDIDRPKNLPTNRTALIDGRGRTVGIIFDPDYARSICSAVNRSKVVV